MWILPKQGLFLSGILCLLIVAGCQVDLEKIDLSHDDQSGKPFTLKKGESITQRIGILVHMGNVKTGRVAERFELYIKGKLQK